jgi:hypothetical protein
MGVTLSSIFSGQFAICGKYSFQFYLVLKRDGRLRTKLDPLVRHLFVYINVMRSWLNGTGNTSIYEDKNSCYVKLYIFRLAQRRFVES